MTRHDRFQDRQEEFRWTVLGVLLLAAAFTLATQLTLWRERSERLRGRSGSVLQILIGDSQRLFANHFFTKADVYLHSGVYPSIFDQAQREKKLHLAEEAGPSTGGGDAHAPEDHDHSQCEHDHGSAAHDAQDVVSGFLTPPRDWIDRFGRNFFPTQHVHLDDKGKQEEILPWLRLAAELNPNEVETYTVAAYWLRSRMGKPEEAEEFLRQGWRANPESYEILFELGRLHEENQHDLTRARTLYELALSKWRQHEQSKPAPDTISVQQISGRLARVEEAQGRFSEAIRYLELLRHYSPNPQQITAQIAALEAKLKSESRGKRL